MSTKIEVKESYRLVVFEGGYKAKFRNVVAVDNTGNWLRMETEGGEYILVNSDKVLYIQVPLEAKVF